MKIYVGFRLNSGTVLEVAAYAFLIVGWAVLEVLNK